MKQTMTILLLVCLTLALSVPASGESKPKPAGTNSIVQRPAKGTLTKPVIFQVNQVMFNEVHMNNKTYLAVGVIFNRNIDATSVRQNYNIRLLKKNKSNLWVDASTQNNTVRINLNSISWLSGAPLETGDYRLHLRGTLKSTDGIYLDCNGDGKGEGGNLPAYESQIYHAEVQLQLQLVPKEQ
jgi:hypothetical protein